MGKLRSNSTFFDFSEKYEKLKKLEISEFDFFAISANMKKKTQENWRDGLLKLDKLENTLVLLQKKDYIFLDLLHI